MTGDRIADGGRFPSLAVLGLIVAALLGACQEEKPAAQTPVRPVRTQVVEFADWRNPGSAIGEIKPRYEADIGFRIPGKIATRVVDVGALVQKSALLATLDNTNEKTAVAVAATDVQAAQAEVADAAGNEGRQRDLLSRGFTTKASFDAAERRLKLAKAKLEAAELAAKDASERLSYTELRADEPGVVTAVRAQAGQVVAAGQMVVRIARTDAKEAEFKVSERLLRSVPSNTVVTVTLLGDPNIRASGHVREVATTADPITRTFAVRVALSNPSEAMRFGAAVQGQIVITEKGIVQLPSSALFQSDNKQAVWVFDPATSTVNLRQVQVLRYEADVVLVSAGLNKGERVVTAGIHKLWPGLKVKLW